jgi:hypothetical protein
MNENRAINHGIDLSVLLRGDLDCLSAWVSRWNSRRVAFCLAVIFLGAGCYGAAMGMWRAPLQALYVATKFPLIILLTSLSNGLLNAMLAPLLGLNIGLRQSFLAILISFTIASAILGAFSPLLAFLVWNAPPLSAAAQAGATYSVIQLLQVLIISFAGITANVRLIQLLRRFSTSPAAASRVLFAWLAGNLFFGSQLTWILRPFIGSPGLPVEFLRKDALHGNFYETVFRSILYLLTSK